MKIEEVSKPKALSPTTTEHQQFNTVHKPTSDILSPPETVLKQGSDMVESIEEAIRKLEIGSQLRKDVWLKEIERSAAFRNLMTCSKVKH